MKFVLLALDADHAPKAVASMQAQLEDGDQLKVVATKHIADIDVYLPAGAQRDYSLSDSMALLDRLARTVQLYFANHALWRALRADRGFINLVEWADMVVLGDELSMRTAWQVARRSSTPVWGRIATVGYARTRIASR